MHSLIKTIFILFAASLFCFSISTVLRAQEGKIYLTFKDQTLSADLEEAPLKVIINRFKEEKGIWFKGKESLLDEKVSLQFKDLPIEKGLQRILSDMNYSLLFDKDANVVGVILIGKSGTTSGRKGRQSVAPRRRTPRRSPQRNVIRPQPRD